MTAFTPPRVLIVEDNLETQLLLRHLLKAEYDLVTVGGIQEAIEATSEQTFDLLILDINLGEEQTGVDLLEMLQSEDDSPPTPSLALTAYAMPGDRDTFLDAGFDAYVSKPFTREDLTEAVHQVLDKKPAS